RRRHIDQHRSRFGEAPESLREVHGHYHVRLKLSDRVDSRHHASAVKDHLWRVSFQDRNNGLAILRQIDANHLRRWSMGYSADRVMTGFQGLAKGSTDATSGTGNQSRSFVHLAARVWGRGSKALLSRAPTDCSGLWSAD